MQRIASSAALEAQIADLLSQGIDDHEHLSELGRLGTRLVLQRAVEDEDPLVRSHAAQKLVSRRPDVAGELFLRTYAHLWCISTRR